MENFERMGPSPFLPGGETKDTDICFNGGSTLEVYGGATYSNFRLKFSNSAGEGWWVGPDSLDQLIAELLYIRRDMRGFKDGIALDIEVGAAPAYPWDHPEEEEEEDNGAPF